MLFWRGLKMRKFDPSPIKIGWEMTKLQDFKVLFINSFINFDVFSFTLSLLFIIGSTL